MNRIRLWDDATFESKRKANRRAWIIWAIETAACLAIGAWLGWMYGRVL